MQEWLLMLPKLAVTPLFAAAVETEVTVPTDQERLTAKVCAVPLMVIVLDVGTPPKPLNVWSPVFVPLELLPVTVPVAATELGVIAPNPIVNAGVVVAVAQVAVTPLFATAVETEVTVPTDHVRSAAKFCAVPLMVIVLDVGARPLKSARLDGSRLAVTACYRSRSATEEGVIAAKPIVSAGVVEGVAHVAVTPLFAAAVETEVTLAAPTAARLTN